MIGRPPFELVANAIYNSYIMTRTVEAIYTNGHLEPVESLDLPEQQRVRLTVEPLESKKEGAGDEAFRHFQESVEEGSFYLNGPLPTRDELHER